MAELGAIASIVGIAGAGAKLSMVLFEFASTVGSARYEVQQIGTEISQFCAVLKQLHSTLTKAKVRRYSISAIGTTQDILKRCQEVFKEIEGIVEGLRRRKGREVDLVARVKWTFKRSQVEILRKTLESSKGSLQLMLLVLDLAQKTASPRGSTIATQLEDEQEQAVIQSLIAAHRCAVDQLERLEDEAEEQNEEQGPSPPSPDAGTIQLPTKTKKRMNGGYGAPDGGGKKQRASVWVSDLIFDNGPLPAGFRRNTWGDTVSASSLAPQAGRLFEKWTIKANTEAVRPCDYQEKAVKETAESSKEEDRDKLIVPPKPPVPPPSLTVRQHTSYVLALYDYVADDRTSLTFREGDVIQVISQLESGWWDGVINGVRGWFPSNYCQVIGAGESIQEIQVSSNGNEYEESSDEESDNDLENVLEKKEGTRADCWVPQATPDGRLFFYNTQTGESSAIEDTNQSKETGNKNKKKEVDKDVKADFWIPQAMPDGRLYYFNTLTGESSVEFPLESPESARGNRRVENGDEDEDEDEDDELLMDEVFISIL